MDNDRKIRVRFAPAPTGFLHIGGARTALFNYLFARRHQGTFVLRIEDTDADKSKPGFEKDILENLQWLGIFWDEGPTPISQKDIGDYGPYRQSERGDIYKKHIKKLLTEDKAYYCFCSLEELKNMREYQISAGRQAPRYSGKCRTMSKKEARKKLAQGEQAIIRFKVSSQQIKFKDLIRQNLEFDTDLIGDFSLAKVRGKRILPLYNFAAVCDDFEMKISHVIRGEDHLPNTPKQILLQQALNFPQPEYCHLPLILGTDKSKLSKRSGAKPLICYKKEGYLAEALINFIALLGWHPKIEKEIFSLSFLIKEFSLEKAQKSGAIFNVKKLDFLNGFYIRQKSLSRLTELCVPYLIRAGLIEPVSDLKDSNFNKENLIQPYKIPAIKESLSLERLQKIIALYHKRLKKLSEIVELIDFFFKERLDYNKDLLRWKTVMTDKELKNLLKKLIKILLKIKDIDWTRSNLEKILITQAEKLSIQFGAGDRGYLLWPLRIALTGKESSAPPFSIAEILGKKKTLKRIEQAIEKF